MLMDARVGPGPPQEVRRGRAVVAMEGTRELSGLAIADAGRDVADGDPASAEELARPAHAHPREVRPEAGAADLGEGALQLPARGGDPVRDVVELERGRVLALDDLERFDVKRPAAGLGGGPDCGDSVIMGASEPPVERNYVRLASIGT
jgi:hypothetical protein